MADSEEFVYNTDVSYYFKQGWTLFSPTKMVCPRCDSALVQNTKYDFLFCVPCQAKVVVDNSQKYSNNSSVPPSVETNQQNVNLSQSEKAVETGVQKNPKQPSLLLQGWKMTNYVCPTPNCHFPLMQQPHGTKLVCEQCGFESEVGKNIKKVTTSVDPSLLSKQIAQRVQERLNEYQQEGSNKGATEVSEEEDDYNENQEQRYDDQQKSQFVQQLDDLDQKIYDVINTVLEPNNDQEIASLHKHIALLTDTRQLLCQILGKK